MAVYKVTVDEAVTTLGVTEAVTILSEQVTGVQGATGLTGATGATGATGSSGVVGVDSDELTNTGTSTSAQLGLATAGTAGTYTKVTTDTFGRVTTGTTLVAGDIPTIAATQVTNTAYTLSNKINEEYRLASTLDTIPRALLSTTRGLNNGVVYAVYFTPSENITISNLSSMCTTGGTDVGGTTVRRMGLFTVSGLSLTLVARTASDATLWNTTSTLYTRALNTTGGYPSSYTLTAGTTYAFGCFAYNTGGVFGSSQISSGATFAPFISPTMCANLNSQTDLPTTATTFSQGISSLIFGRLS